MFTYNTEIISKEEASKLHAFLDNYTHTVPIEATKYISSEERGSHTGLNPRRGAVGSRQLHGEGEASFFGDMDTGR